MAKRIETFREFWPFYVSEHSHPLNRRLHFIGSSLVLICLAAAVATQIWWLLPLMPVAGYGFAWFGHFFVEKNRPASFKQPFYSFAADWVMYSKMWAGTMDAQVAEVAKLPSRRAAA